jgi:hypothetical protein
METLDMNTQPLRLIRSLILLGLLLLSAVPASANPYYNSSEPGCDGSNSNVVFCDDFEDGTWYVNDCDHRTAADDGWCGSIYANPITPANAIICGAGVTPFGNCAGNAGTKGGSTDRNGAMRSLKTSGCGTDGTQKCGVSTLYVRWYAKWTSGYSFGAEKHTNFTTLDGDIAFANVQLNCGAGGGSSTATPYIQILHGETVCQAPNVSSITLTSNRWYFFEMRVTADATNGTIQLWINDCGAAGTSCGPLPILRTQMTGLRLPGNANGSTISGIWFESWANPVSTGTGPYWDQIKASTTGPIGFMGGIAAPSNLRVQ